MPSLKNKSVLIFLFILIITLGTGAFLLAGPTDILDTLRKSELTIRWTTESELDIVGFNLYRSDTPDGDFVKINDELIPPAQDPFIGGEHTFVDENVIRGETYYYELETIDRQGNATRKGPYAISADG
jgi:hypothetical protein